MKSSDATRKCYILLYFSSIGGFLLFTKASRLILELSPTVTSYSHMSKESTLEAIQVGIDYEFEFQITMALLHQEYRGKSEKYLKQ